MTPGPTPAPPEVLAAIAQPVLHHRGPDYKKLYAECLERLREIFRTEAEVLLFGGSGTGAMESAVANLCSPGEPVLVVSAGYFGERWAAGDRRVGDRRRRLRRAEGADDPARPGDGLRLSRSVGEERELRLTAVLLGLGAHAQGPGDPRCARHPARLARRRVERRAGDTARGGPRVGLRAARSPGPRLP